MGECRVGRIRPGRFSRKWDGGMSEAVLEAVSFTPAASLLPGFVAKGCVACVTIPVRNERDTLPSCLDALHAQVDLDGEPLSKSSFEVLLLLNNCTDDSLAVAQRWQRRHPEMQLHPLVQALDPSEAHAGTARRLLMDTAWQRAGSENTHPRFAILATDADSVAAPDWIAQNLAALRAGADAVGGAIYLRAEDLAALPAQVRTCYEQDRRYAALVAQLEDLLDPQAGDPWPRHLDHFGSSLACTAAAYARAGGMPAVAPLEDEAFVDRLRRANLRLRHQPEVRVFTSGRLQGRATVGLAGQLRLWNELGGQDQHLVQSATYLAHRFRTLRQLREAFTGRHLASFPDLPADEQQEIRNSLRHEETFPAFLAAIDCDSLIAKTCSGECEEQIADAIASLQAEIAGSGADQTRRSTEIR